MLFKSLIPALFALLPLTLASPLASDVKARDESQDPRNIAIYTNLNDFKTGKIQFTFLDGDLEPPSDLLPKGSSHAFQVNDKGEITENRKFQVKVQGAGDNGSADVQCEIQGNLKEGVHGVGFAFQSGPDYLTKCGCHDGITVYCTGPGAFCHGGVPRCE